MGRTREYLRSIEEDAPEAVLRGFFGPGVEFEEFPNRFTPNGARRDLEGALEASRRGRAAVENQRYEVLKALEVGDTVALEVNWSAVLKIPVGSLKPGDVMKARFAVFITYRDGLIVSQRNYDCFEPF